MQNIAIAGFGAMGQLHAKAYDLISKARLVAIINKDVKQSQEALGRLELDVPIYPDFQSAFAAAKIDAVDICLPTDLHASACVEVIKAGKNLICEKPLAPTLEEAKKVVASARRAGVRFMIGHCIRFWPEYQHLESLVKSKKAGKLVSLSLQRRCSTPAYSQGNWLVNSARSGGAVLDLHIHDVDYIMHLLGKPKSLMSIGTKDKLGWSHVFTQYEYDGIAVSTEAGWNYPSKWGFNMTFQAVFQKGALEFDFRSSPTLRQTLGDGETELISPNQGKVAGSAGAVVGNISDLGGYLNELEYFVNCLERKCQPKIATGEQSFESLRLCFAEIKSLETGKPVKFK